MKNHSDFRLGMVVVFILSLIVLGYLYTHNPNEDDGFLPCFFHQITGLWCPFCGATRSLYALMHFDVIDALHKNVFFVLVGIPSLVLVLVPEFLHCSRFSARGQSRFFMFFILTAIGFTLLRNIPIYPLNLLAP